MATERARAQAKSHLEHIVDLIHRLRAAQDAGDKAAEDAARAEIKELPLVILVRSGWYRPGEDVGPPEEYQIILEPGSPVVRIIGILDSRRRPFTALLEYADLGTPLTAYPADPEEEEALLEFARQFYYYGG